MNCNDAKLKILLKSSGELSVTEQAELDSHLNGCGDCLQYSRDKSDIMELAVQAMSDIGPSAEVMNNIKERSQSVKRAPLIFRRHIIQWAAAAALVMIVLGNWSLRPLSDNANTEISDMYAVLAIVTDNAYTDDAIDGEQDLPDMEELLLQIEDSADNYEITEEELWVPQTKYPQSSNTRGIQRKIYG